MAFFTLPKQHRQPAKLVGFGLYGCRSLPLSEKENQLEDDTMSCCSDNLTSISQMETLSYFSEDSISWKSFSSISSGESYRSVSSSNRGSTSLSSSPKKSSSKRSESSKRKKKTSKWCIFSIWMKTI